MDELVRWSSIEQTRTSLKERSLRRPDNCSACGAPLRVEWYLLTAPEPFPATVSPMIYCLCKGCARAASEYLEAQAGALGLRKE